MISQKLKYTNSKYNSLNNKNTLILNLSIFCINKEVDDINIPNNINTIGYKCFSDCINIKSLHIPQNIYNIEKGAFYNCINLEKVNLSDNISNLKSDTFFNCINLKNINLKNINSIGENCFFNCENLDNITLSNDIKTIENSAFKNCFNLSSLTLPNSIKSIGENVFFNCINLEKVILPDNIEFLESYLFGNCKKIDKIVVPQSVTEIKDLVFFGCSNLISIELSKNLSYIGSRVFSNCTNLEIIDLPNTISSIGQSIFDNCTKLNKVTLPNQLTYIPSGTFNNCCKLEIVTIPKTVIQINNSAFSNCTNLTNITLPQQLQSIGSNAFYGCENLKSINLPQTLKNIGTAAFYNCKTLSEVNIPDTMNGLNSFTFSNCTNLKNVKLPKRLSRIPNSCFSNCTSLKNITLPESLNFIDSNAFSNCTSLEFIRLPKSIKAIKDDAFNTCTNLRKVIVPKYIKCISNSAFKNCPNIIIYGEKNSYIHKYAIANNLEFKEYHFINLRNISIENESISMLNNEEEKLNLVLHPQNTNDIFKVKWESSDENIVSVKNGIIKSHNIGIATITASVGHNKISKCVVKVNLPLQKIYFENNNLELNKGESKTLKLECFPQNHTCTKTPIWSSSCENIANVDSYGNISAINKGRCTIICTLDNKSTSCNVNVNIPLEKIHLDASALNLKCNDVHKLNVSYIPEDTTDDITLNWSAMDSSIVSITNDGTIKALKAGTTVVIASTNNKIASCLVTVRTTLSEIKFKDDKIDLKVDESINLDIFDQSDNKIPCELISWNISDKNIAKIEDNRLIALNNGTTVLIAQFENLVAACILSISLKKIRLFDINYLKSNANIITGKGIEGATVKAFKDDKLISDIYIIGHDKRFLLNIEPQNAGSKIKVEISKNGYEMRHEFITCLYEFDVFSVNSIQNTEDNFINISGQGCIGAHIRAYIKNTQIGKTAIVNQDSTFNIDLPKIKSGTTITLKMRKTNYVTSNKNILIP